MSRFRFVLAIFLAAFAASLAAAADLPRIIKVERQPLEAQVKRVVQTLDLLGAPLPRADKKALAKAAQKKRNAATVATIQAILDKHCLAYLDISDGKKATRLSVKQGPAPAELAEQGWRVFLIKVH